MNCILCGEEICYEGDEGYEPWFTVVTKPKQFKQKKFPAERIYAHHSCYKKLLKKNNNFNSI